MLALRLTRGSHPLVLVRRLALAAASAGVGFLLLCTLGYAAGHPAHASGSVLRLLWCAVPLAATVQFAVAVARTDPSTRPRPGLFAAGLGPARLALLAAISTAVSTTLGSVVALLFFLHLRGDLTGLPFDGGAAEFLGAGTPLPLAAALMLLALVPLASSAAGGLALRSRPVAPSEAQADEDDLAPAPVAEGAALGSGAHRGRTRGRGLRQPGLGGQPVPAARPVRLHPRGRARGLGPHRGRPGHGGTRPHPSVRTAAPGGAPREPYGCWPAGS